MPTARGVSCQQPQQAQAWATRACLVQARTVPGAVLSLCVPLCASRRLSPSRAAMVMQTRVQGLPLHVKRDESMVVRCATRLQQPARAVSMSMMAGSGSGADSSRCMSPSRAAPDSGASGFASFAALQSAWLNPLFQLRYQDRKNAQQASTCYWWWWDKPACMAHCKGLALASMAVWLPDLSWQHCVHGASPTAFSSGCCFKGCSW
jgi:hypothetical protein